MKVYQLPRCPKIFYVSPDDDPEWRDHPGGPYQF